MNVDIESALTHYREHGWARLGVVADEETLTALRTRADDIMMGRVVYPGMFFQHDSPTGDYNNLERGQGWVGPRLSYRKIEKLEMDPLFLSWLEQPLFEKIAKTFIGPEIAIYRATLFTKSSEGGTYLPWHQDAGSFWGLDRDPQLQIWTALDDAPLEAGCVEAVDGSHKGGLATPLGGLVPQHARDRENAEARKISIPAVAGEVLLIHNYLWHCSGVNTTGRPRRGFTVAYMDAATRCLRKKGTPRSFMRVFQR